MNNINYQNLNGFVKINYFIVSQSFDSKPTP